MMRIFLNKTASAFVQRTIGLAAKNHKLSFNSSEGLTKFHHDPVPGPQSFMSEVPKTAEFHKLRITAHNSVSLSPYVTISDGHSRTMISSFRYVRKFK
jgi:hypothetical protein